MRMIFHITQCFQQPLSIFVKLTHFSRVNPGQATIQRESSWRSTIYTVTSPYRAER